jgi:FAD/FMN-containing dehydrogenase
MWQARHDAYWAAWPAPGLPVGHRRLRADLALAECILETKKDIEATALGRSSGHVGDGNFHLTMMVDPTTRPSSSAPRAFNERLVARAIAMEGTCTGEHGVGQGKIKYLSRSTARRCRCVMRAIKRRQKGRQSTRRRTHSLMNPGSLRAVLRQRHRRQAHQAQARNHTLHQYLPSPRSSDG